MKDYPKCEDCKFYRMYKGKMYCTFLLPFLSLKKIQRAKHPIGTMNCGIEGKHFEPKEEKL